MLFRSAWRVGYFLLLYHAFLACTRSRNRSAVTDVLAGVGSVPDRVPAQSIVALSPGGELYILPRKPWHKKYIFCDWKIETRIFGFF